MFNTSETFPRVLKLINLVSHHCNEITFGTEEIQFTALGMLVIFYLHKLTDSEYKILMKSLVSNGCRTLVVNVKCDMTIFNTRKQKMLDVSTHMHLYNEVIHEFEQENK